VGANPKFLRGWLQLVWNVAWKGTAGFGVLRCEDRVRIGKEERLLIYVCYQLILK
jgi:hypothetical protein